MISTLKDKDGFIGAYIEWDTVDKQGMSSKDGEYVFVKDLWLHRNYREGFGKKKIIKLLVNEMVKKKECQQAKYVYWRRTKYDRMSKTYLAAQFKKGVPDEILDMD